MQSETQVRAVFLSISASRSRSLCYGIDANYGDLNHNCIVL